MEWIEHSILQLEMDDQIQASVPTYMICSAHRISTGTVQEFTITLHQCLLSQQHGTCSYHLCRWHEHSPQLSPTMAVILRCSTLSWRESVREAYLNWSFTHSLIIYYPTWLTDVPWKLTVKCSIREPEPSEIEKVHMLYLLWMTIQVRWKITTHTFKYLPPRYIGDLKHDITRWQGLNTWSDRISWWKSWYRHFPISNNKTILW